jgi:hypothetical protein
MITAFFMLRQTLQTRLSVTMAKEAEESGDMNASPTPWKPHKLSLYPSGVS